MKNSAHCRRCSPGVGGKTTIVKRRLCKVARRQYVSYCVHPLHANLLENTDHALRNGEVSKDAG